MTKFRIILTISSNRVDLSKYHIDSILMVRIIYPDMTPVFNLNDTHGEKFMHDPFTKTLEILTEINKDTKIVIEFYSKAENRDKLLNEILNLNE